MFLSFCGIILVTCNALAIMAIAPSYWHIVIALFGCKSDVWVEKKLRLKIYTRHDLTKHIKSRTILSQISILSISAQSQCLRHYRELLILIVTYLFHRCSDDIIVTLVSLVTSEDGPMVGRMAPRQRCHWWNLIFARVRSDLLSQY